MTETRLWGLVLVGLSVLGLAVRLYAAAHIGFGDSEALYASYALHPAPAYLDHPGLIALFARLLGGGSAPSPMAAHRVTAVLATLAPWGVVWAARAVRAELRFALIAGVATAVVPEVSVGLFGMTPDLLLFPLWMAALGLAGAGLLAAPSSVRSAACFVLAGLATGASLADKATGAGLVIALVLAYLSRAARPHARTAWPWAGLALGGLIVFPVVDFEAKAGWPLIFHRFVATQGQAGVSLRNLGALLGGQLAYLSPPMAVVAVLVARSLWKTRGQDAVTRLLLYAFVAPLVLLVPLCLWSRVAEPHWIAPALLALPLAYARRATLEGGFPLPRRLARAAFGLASASSVAIHAWVLVPGLALVVPASLYDARVDISNELYGWPFVFDAVEALAAKHHLEAPDPGEIVVVGPHWVVCAQLEAAIGTEIPVGCASREPADFRYWNPPDRWESATLLFFVRDDRFPDDARTRFPDRVRIDSRSLDIRRAGRIVRSFSVDVLAERGAALRDAAPSGDRVSLKAAAPSGDRVSLKAAAPSGDRVSLKAAAPSGDRVSLRRRRRATANTSAPGVSPGEGCYASRVRSGDLVVRKYRLVRRLGAGGMGVVWEATHLVTGRPFAIKFLSSPEHEEHYARFLLEAKVSGLVRHPSIVDVYDVGAAPELGNVPFLVMELLDGLSLGEMLVSTHRLSLEQTFALALPLVSAAAAAHEAGVIHRDLKPSNLFFHRPANGGVVPKILDFGISKLVGSARDRDREANHRLTRTGTVLGSPLYMSPEQVRGETTLDARSDIHALGSVIWECLAGNPLFSAALDDRELAAQISNGVRPLLSSAWAECPLALSALLDRSVAPRKEDRFDTARELLLELERLREKLGLPASLTDPKSALALFPILAQPHPREGLARVSLERATTVDSQFPAPLARTLSHEVVPTADTVLENARSLAWDEKERRTGSSTILKRRWQSLLAAAAIGALLVFGVLRVRSSPDESRNFAQSGPGSEPRAAIPAPMAVPTPSSAPADSAPTRAAESPPTLAVSDAAPPASPPRETSAKSAPRPAAALAHPEGRVVRDAGPEAVGTSANGAPIIR
jgi:serine/threonine protein kinase